MKFINFKKISKQKKIMLIGAGVLLAAVIAVFARSKFQPAKKPEPFNAFLKESKANNNGLNTVLPPFVSKPVAGNNKKKQGNKLNDLFKLKGKKNIAGSPIPKVAGTASYPVLYPGAVQPAAGYPNINNISNVIRNIKSHMPSSVSGRDDFIVMGISGQNAVIQYAGANLYLQAGEAFGNCSIMEIGYSSVKILCGRKAKSYPVSFGENNQGNVKINQVQSITKVK